MSRRQRALRRMVRAIEELQPRTQSLADHDLTVTQELSPVEVIARAREAGRRNLGEEARPNQLLCAVSVWSGAIAEMPTGEGKTLAAALAASALAVSEGGVHVMTVNDYLAERDARWMAPIYSALGLTVGAVGGGQDVVARQGAYNADITYGSNLEIGFDYLRDGLVHRRADKRQRQLRALIIDEADSILIDEARIPIVISAPGDPAGSWPYEAALIVEDLELGMHYDVDTRRNVVWFTDAGQSEIAERADLLTMLPHATNALRARVLYRRDRDYVVRGDTVDLVDEYTGRTVAHRRWSDGLHQAVEAKERLPLTRPRVTHAQITIRSLVALYAHVGGLTATAVEAGRELGRTLGLDVVAVSPHVPSQRRDHHDRIFTSSKEKIDAVVTEVVRRHETGQPLLIGCATVAGSDSLSARLRDEDIDHVVLNARDDALEAEIIARAGRVGAVTIATHMAGRGVDIKLGPGASERGGLCVIGTERYESSRIERQLRGRAGRQGDPGESIFFVTPRDPLIADWSPARADPKRQMQIAQHNVEAHNATLRFDLHAFATAMERQRLAARRWRDELLDSGDIAAVERFDKRWVAHLYALFDVLDGIHFRAWAGQSPLAAWNLASARLFIAFAEERDPEPLPPPDAEVTEAEAADWITRLGPRAPEPELPHVTDRVPGTRSVAAFQPEFGGAVRLDVVAVSDVDGSRPR